jgi:selenocysteine lyase/cysteine desulfurase
LARDWNHLASFLLVSHPRPVAESIEYFRTRIDADPFWIEIAAFSDTEGRPFEAVKRSLGEYIGGEPREICLTSNTTSALAMLYHGLRIRPDQHILTTEHDHYSHHESIRYAADRSGCGVRYVSLYDAPAAANTDEMVERVASAITTSTRAVGITWVHSSTGVKTPVAQIAEAVALANRDRASEDRCLLVVDGVHGFANQDVDVAALGCDFFASGTHKWLFAPRGTGFLWGRGDVWPQVRPTIPSFDPDGGATWEAWMGRSELPPTEAAFVSPGGFLAYEHLLAVPAAVTLHQTLGRAQIASRIADLNGAFRDGVSDVGGVTLHTPLDPALSGGISCFEVDGYTALEVTEALAARRIRTSNSPYQVSYARVSCGIMNSPEDVAAVLLAIRELAG